MCSSSKTYIHCTYTLYTHNVISTEAHTSQAGSCPLILVGLLPSEQRMSVLNFLVRRHSSFSEPLKSKERLVIQCGFRRFSCNPIFSDHSNIDKHKVSFTASMPSSHDIRSPENLTVAFSKLNFKMWYRCLNKFLIRTACPITPTQFTAAEFYLRLCNSIVTFHPLTLVFHITR